MVAMNVSLTPELDRFVRSLVDEGRYLSSSEVVREGLRLLQDRQRLREAKLAELRGEIAAGLESGPPEPLDFTQVRRRGQAKLAAERAGQDG